MSTGAHSKFGLKAFVSLENTTGRINYWCCYSRLMVYL